MSLVSDALQEKKLDKYGINIKTKYIVGNEVLERNTDNSFNNDIRKGIRCCKEYYVNRELKHEEKEFDSRIEYTFVAGGGEDDYKCANCGVIGKVKDFIEGCPYCGTHYNIEYSSKDLGSKYHYDRVLKSNLYRIITLVVDLIVSLLVSFLFIKMTSRTFNSYDIGKIFIYGIILCLVLYYMFYVLDAYVVLEPIKRYKDRQNEKQELFWQKNKIEKSFFYNNFNYEMRKYFYSMDNVIDYDILDYLEFKDYNEDGLLCVDVKILVRLVYYDKGKICSRKATGCYRMVRRHTDILEIKGGINYIKCHNCGSSIDVISGKCEYCGTEINYLQEWVLDRKI